ncbi:hypothetical protein K440DRAFT_620708 [Wilcoxina mikolae CBS 423.85]|nr:hypothetical protein K440DRAFT_620708 [Wilcoxina mikolae CBS 423.85]
MGLFSSDDQLGEDISDSQHMAVDLGVGGLQGDDYGFHPDESDTELEWDGILLGDSEALLLTDRSISEIANRTPENSFHMVEPRVYQDEGDINYECNTIPLPISATPQLMDGSIPSFMNETPEDSAQPTGDSRTISPSSSHTVPVETPPIQDAQRRRLHRCSQCPEVFFTSSNRRRHEKSVHGGSIQCSHCLTRIRDRSDYKKKHARACKAQRRNVF